VVGRFFHNPVSERRVGSNDDWIDRVGTGLVFAQGSNATIIGTVKDVSGSVVGAYEVTAGKIGFSREVRRGIELVVAQEAVAKLTLQGRLRPENAPCVAVLSLEEESRF
jgi:hypothetical protein